MQCYFHQFRISLTFFKHLVLLDMSSVPVCIIICSGAFCKLVLIWSKISVEDALGYFRIFILMFSSLFILLRNTGLHRVSYDQKQPPEVRKDVLKVSQNSQENTCARLSFSIKLQTWPGTLLKKEALAQVFSCEFWEIFKNTFFIEHLMTASVWFRYVTFLQN